MRTAFAAHAVPPSPRTMASAPAVPRIISRRVRQRPDARENQIAATMQAAPSAGPTMTRPVRNRSNSVPNQAKVTSRVPAMLPRSAQPTPKAISPRNAMAIKNTGVSEDLFGSKIGDAPLMFAAAHAALPSRALRAKVRRVSGALMSFPAILLPLFVQVFLIFALLIWMAVARGRALRGGEVRPVDIALRQRAWP